MAKPLGLDVLAAAEGQALVETLGIDPAKVSETRHETVFGGASFMTLTGYRVWLASHICDGSFVIELDRQCRMTGSFSSGSCDRDALAKAAPGKERPGR